MNNRLAIQDLAGLLAEYTGKDKNSSERFLREFIAVVSEGVYTDKLVKVKGLGTFKIIPVEKRESIHVNTGERFVIPEHYKFSFLPDKELRELVVSLVKVLCSIADENTETIMPGYTHLQRAQPITFGHHMMAYAQMLLRDIERFDDTLRRMNVSPLGSCALAGTTYHINRDRTAELLGMEAPMVNSLDGVSDRDFCIELASAISICMMHLSRFSEEIIMWCSWEFKFIELSDRFSTGSSIMPQKKNPDVTELIRGKTARVIGDNMTLLAMMKGLPLAYNKDMQEDKEAIFDAVDNLKLCLTTFIPMLETMTLYKDNMRKAAAKGFINATDCADYLVKKGMPFRTAYKITGGLVAHCIELGTTLEELPLADYQKQSDLFTDDVYEAISLDTCVRERKSFGGPAPESVKKQIELTRKKLEELCNG